MTPALWITAIPVSTGVLLIGIRMIVGMTRLVDSVDRIGRSMEKIAEQAADHEKRLTRWGL